MRRLAFALLLVLSTSGSASATLIDFSTASSVLSCSGAASCTPGTGNVLNFALSTGGPAFLQVTYSANIEDDLEVNPLSSTNFGQLFLLCVSCGGQTGSFDLTGAVLALNVSQGPDPFADSGTFGTGVLAGALTLAAGNFGGVGQVGWVAPSFELSDGLETSRYVLQQPTPPVPAAYLLSIDAATTLQGLISTRTVPEPGTGLLLALGLATLLVRGRG